MSGRRPNPRAAPSRTTPRFTRGDVLATMDPDTWGLRRTRYSRLMLAAIAALIACGRVSLSSVCKFKLADYDADRLTTKTCRGTSYPAILLPVVRKAIDRYLVLRRKRGGTALFVGDRGGTLQSNYLSDSFDLLALRYGLQGGQIVERLIEFFDHGLAKEPDRAAAIALRRGTGRRQAGVSPSQLRRAVADPARLKSVLQRRHRLSGPPGQWLGGHAKTKIAKEARLFQGTRRTIVKITQTMRNDPVCARLLRYEWRASGQTLQRREIVRNDLGYLVGLLDAGLLTRTQIGYLLNISNCYASYVISKYRRACAAKAGTLRDADSWNEQMLQLYRAKPAAENLWLFYRRIAQPSIGYPRPFFDLLDGLRAAGLWAPAQVGDRQKVEKRDVTVEEKPADRTEKRRLKRPERPQNGIIMHENASKLVAGRFNLPEAHSNLLQSAQTDEGGRRRYGGEKSAPEENIRTNRNERNGS